MKKKTAKDNAHNSPVIKFMYGEQIPIEQHKVRIVQKLHLKPVDERLKAIKAAGYNSFLLSTQNVFLDMLTDSGTNAMSDRQVSSMLVADDAYAGSQSFERLQKAVKDVFGKKYFLPAHQGRAAEHVIFQAYIKQGDVIPMNYHFTTTKAHADLVYFSSRKVSSTRGGGICTNNVHIYDKLKDLVILFEGFLTYGGMSVREIEAMAVGLRETQDETCISQSPQFIKYLVDALETAGVPVVTPAGGLGCHVDARGFLPHVPQTEYPAGALTAAFYIISGVRGMERGTISSVRDVSGKDILADVELLRLAMPRRVFTLSQVKFVADRLQWLYKNRKLVGGLQFEYEPTVLRFFTGRLTPTSRWPEKLVAKFKKDFGSSL